MFWFQIDIGGLSILARLSRRSHECLAETAGYLVPDAAVAGWSLCW